MKLRKDRPMTVGQDFRVTVRTDVEDQFERAMSLAFNDRIANYVAATKAFGLVFLSYVESDQEIDALTQPTYFDIEPHHIDIENHKMSRAAAQEKYQILHLSPSLTVGPAIQYAKDWLERLGDDQFHYIAGAKERNWDLATFSGVEVSTGSAMGHVGQHTSAICYVKPTWLISSRQF